MLIRIKITTTLILLEICLKINPIQNIFIRMFVYYKCYVLIELTFSEGIDVDETSASK